MIVEGNKPKGKNMIKKKQNKKAKQKLNRKKNTKKMKNIASPKFEPSL